MDGLSKKGKKEFLAAKMEFELDARLRKYNQEQDEKLASLLLERELLKIKLRGIK